LKGDIPCIPSKCNKDKKLKMSGKISGWVLVLILGLVGGCNSSGQQVEKEAAPKVVTQVQPSEAGLRTRVLARWDALIKRNFEEAYQYLSPAYRRLYPLDVFVARFGSSVIWDSVNITSVAVMPGDDSAKVVLELFYQLALPGVDGARLGADVGLISKTVHESWIWADDEWWFVEPSDK